MKDWIQAINDFHNCIFDGYNNDE